MLEEKICINLWHLGSNNCFLGMIPQAQETKAKNRWIGLHQNFKLLYLKGHHQESEENVQCTEREKIFENQIWYGFSIEGI